MKDEEIVEVLRQCRSMYRVIHYELGHILTSNEKSLLVKFRYIWEDGLFCRQDIIEASGITQNELAFLSGYIYLLHRMVVDQEVTP